MIINIRKAIKDDCKDFDKMLVKLHNFHAENQSDCLHVEKYISKKEFKKNLKNKNLIYLVAEVDGKVVGIIGAFLFDELVKDEMFMNPTAAINFLYVKKKYRRMGIAKKLIGEVSNICKEKCNGENGRIVLGVGEFNKKAISLYKNMGFNIKNYKMELMI